MYDFVDPLENEMVHLKGLFLIKKFMTNIDASSDNTGSSRKKRE